MGTQLRGIRGATVAADNSREAILSATSDLLQRLIAENKLQIQDIASIFFSVTPDLDAEFPAVAARQMGMETVPLLCLNEIPVRGSLPRCVRILIHANLTWAQKEVRHVYLGEAARLRPDIVGYAS